MRPFMLKREPTFFPSVRNVLAKQLTQPAFQQYLGLQKVIFGGRRCQTFQFVADGLMINSAETLDLWLNAYEYHRDDDKRAVIETACDDFVPPELVRSVNDLYRPGPRSGRA